MMVLRCLFLLSTAYAFAPFRPVWSVAHRQTTRVESSSLFGDVPAPLRTKLDERFAAPTPIQAAAWAQRKAGGMLLFAPTGSGKTLAYLVTALWRRGEQAAAAAAPLDAAAAAAPGAALRSPSEVAFERALLVVAPTRELAVQLAADLRALLPPAGKGPDGEGSVHLAVAGGAFPPSEALARCAAVVGTPSELLMTLKAGGVASRKFVSDVRAHIDRAPLIAFSHLWAHTSLVILPVG
jgi:superfamily II DNA/RNA helicase